MIWNQYLPFDELPSVENPPSGFVQNCNSSPFVTTIGPGNPDPKNVRVDYGIESRISNRAQCSRELFGADSSITHAEFIKYKWDRHYSPRAPIFNKAINPVLKNFKPNSTLEQKAVQILRNWDGSTEPESIGATLAILTWRPIWEAIIVEQALYLPDPVQSFRNAIAWLHKHYGRVDVQLGTVQRMRRADLDIELGGGPDVLNAIHSKIQSGNLIGWAGDSYISIVEFTDTGPRAWSLHQFGNSDNESSEHFKDQVPLFIKRTFRRTNRTEAEVRAHLRREYRPGE